MILHSLIKSQTAVRLVLFTFVCLFVSGAEAQTTTKSSGTSKTGASKTSASKKTTTKSAAANSTVPTFTAAEIDAANPPWAKASVLANRQPDWRLGEKYVEPKARTVANTTAQPVAGAAGAPVQGQQQGGYAAPRDIKGECLEKANTDEDIKKCHAKWRDPEAGNPRCDAIIKEFREAKTKAKPCTGSCIDEMRSCLDGESDSGESALGMAFNMGACTQMGSSACKLMNAGSLKDYEEQKKSAQERKKSAQEQMIEIENDQKTAQSEFKKQVMDLRNTADKEARQQRDAMEKAQQDMQTALKDQDDSVAQALAKIKEQYDKWDQEYIKMRDALRQANDAIVDEEMKMEEVCEADAEEKYRAAESKLLERVQKETSTVKNQAAATQAGYYKREAKKLRKTLEKNYAGFLADCMAGRGKGKQAKNNITRARQQAARLRARLNDEEARIEKLRIEIKDEYAKMQIKAEQNKVQISEQFKKIMENMQSDHQQRITRLNEESQLMQEEYQNQQQHFQRRTMMAAQEMNEANNEFYMASMRTNCAMMNGGSMREAAATRRLESLEGILPAWQTLRDTCDNYKSCINKPSPDGKRNPAAAVKCEDYDSKYRQMEEDMGMDSEDGDGVR